ncbi:protein EXORDIUM-like 2 [Wolffia australiana]
MASRKESSPLLSSVLALVFLSSSLLQAEALPRKLTALVKEPVLTLKYQSGPLLKGTVTVDLVWYGRFSPSQRAIIIDFLRSFTGKPVPNPSVASWWSTTGAYGTGRTAVISLARQVNDEKYSRGKSLKSADLVTLAGKAGASAGIAVVLTSADVAVEGFCTSRCGTHGQRRPGSPFIWVGNSETQCPGQCAWPFHQPIYGPQTPPLVAPNGDVGADGMVINLAALLAGTATNPFGNGYFQGVKEAPLEAASACQGIFGAEAFPGYPGKLLVDGATGGSYNANGLEGRRYLLPAMWDPRTSRCSPLV